MSTVTIGKEEAARRLLKVENGIRALANEINVSDGIVCLLGLEDVMENSRSSLLAQITSEERENPGIKPQKMSMDKVVLLRYSAQQFALVNLAIAELLRSGNKGPKRLLKVPELAFFVGIDYSREEALGVCLKSKLLEPGDRYSGADIHFIAGMEGIRIIIVKKADSYAVEVNESLMKLISKLMLREILRSCVKLNIELVFCKGQEIPDVKLREDITPEWIFEKEGYTIRMLTASDNQAFEWASDFKEVSSRNIAILDKGITPKNRDLLEKEREEIFQGYFQFPNYEKTFMKTYGYSARSLKAIAKALESIALSRTHTVVRDDWHGLIVKIAKKANLGRASVKAILRNLTYDGSSTPEGSVIISFDHEMAYNFHRLSSGVRNRLEKCFRETYDNNMKGEAFEEKCRELLRQKGFAVFPRRIVIEEEFLPIDISIDLWGRAKKSTDLDGLANQRNLILLLECKERKPATERAVRIENLFQKFSVELYHKAKWICENKSKLEQYMGEELESCLSMSRDEPSFVIPLVVCNFLVNDIRSDYSPIITYTELQRIRSSQWQDIRKKLMTQREQQISTFHLNVGSASIKSIAFGLLG
jgi:hypothetical protein